MSEWQPIETAPRDGTKIAIWSPKYDHIPIAHWGEQDGEDEDCNITVFFGWHLEGDRSPCCSCEDSFIGLTDDIDEGFMPTHWMPLPEPPAR